MASQPRQNYGRLSIFSPAGWLPLSFDHTMRSGLRIRLAVRLKRSTVRVSVSMIGSLENHLINFNITFGHLER